MPKGKKKRMTRPTDKLGQVIPVILDPVTLVTLQKIARKKRKLFTTLIRDWVVERSRRELLKEKRGEAGSKSKKRAVGNTGPSRRSPSHVRSVDSRRF
ncbi:MAG: hypothetical protein HY815_11810 [Candidatus Riflebacteria bacterium]|nr:hypothetical protein [Candidatus Riflebacteria bacterium]